MEHIDVLGEGQTIHVGDFNEAQGLLVPVGAYRARQRKEGALALGQLDPQLDHQGSERSFERDAIAHYQACARDFDGAQTLNKESPTAHHRKICSCAYSNASFHSGWSSLCVKCSAQLSERAKFCTLYATCRSTGYIVSFLGPGRTRGVDTFHAAPCFSAKMAGFGCSCGHSRRAVGLGQKRRTQ